MSRFFRLSAQLAIAGTTLVALAHVSLAATDPNAVAQHSNNNVVISTGDQNTNNTDLNSVQTTVTNTTSSVVTNNSDNNDNDGSTTHSINVGQNDRSASINVELSSNASNQTAQDQSSTNPSHSPALSSPGNNTPPTATSTAGADQSAQLLPSFIQYGNSHAASPVVLAHTPPTSGAPAAVPSEPTPSNNLPFNPLASTGLLLNLGQIGVFNQTLAKSFNTFTPATIASKLVRATSEVKTKTLINWLLLVAAMLSVGIVAMWRRSGYSHAPRAQLNVNQFYLQTKMSSGAIARNSLFCKQNLGGLTI